MQININFIPREQKLYFVGGTVRDFILNRPPRDYDMVTTDDPVAIANRIATLSGGRVVRLGRPGVYLYRVTSGRITCDVTEARNKSIISDLTARDFSINAMAVSAMGGEIIDPAGGRFDLKNKIIRMISAENLRDDPLRLLRAYRLAAELEFSISADTLTVIHDEGQRIVQCAGERIRDELIKLFNSPVSSNYIGEFSDTRMASAIFPGIQDLKGCIQNAFHDHDVFDHTIKTYRRLENILHQPESAILSWELAPRFFPGPEKLPLLKCAALLHDIGKPPTKSADTDGKIHFYNHERIGADLAAVICDRLKFSNQQARYVDAVIRNHLRPLFLFRQHLRDSLGQKAVNRFFLKTDPHTVDILLLAAADTLGKGSGADAAGFMEFTGMLINNYIDHFLPAHTAPPLIDGHDVMTVFNLPPSPLIGEILAHIQEQHLLKTVRNRDDALGMVKNFLSRRAAS